MVIMTISNKLIFVFIRLTQQAMWQCVFVMTIRRFCLRALSPHQPAWVTITPARAVIPDAPENKWLRRPLPYYKYALFGLPSPGGWANTALDPREWDRCDCRLPPVPTDRATATQWQSMLTLTRAIVSGIMTGCHILPWLVCQCARCQPGGPIIPTSSLCRGNIFGSDVTAGRHARACRVLIAAARAGT